MKTLYLYKDLGLVTASEYRAWIKRQIKEGHTIMISTEGCVLTKRQLQSIIGGLPDNKVKCKGPKAPLSYRRLTNYKSVV